MPATVIYADTRPHWHDGEKVLMEKGLQQMNAEDFAFAGPGSGLRAYWQFNSSTWVDGSGNGFHLSQTGTVPLVSGKFGNAVNFTNNVANYLSNPNAIITPGVPWSLQAWIKMHSLALDCDLFGNAQVGSSDGWRLRFSAPAQSFALSSFDSAGPSEEQCQSLFPVVNETWTHVVAVVDSNQRATIYVNAQPTSDEHLFWTDPAAPFRVGNDGDLAFFPANAAIDELALWAGRVITPQEVTALYNGGDGRTLS